MGQDLRLSGPQRPHNLTVKHYKGENFVPISTTILFPILLASGKISQNKKWDIYPTGGGCGGNPLRALDLWPRENEHHSL